MSRSRKAPVHTRQNVGHPKWGRAKRIAAKAVRNSKEVPSGGAYKRCSESWAINDYSFYTPKEKKAYRK